MTRKSDHLVLLSKGSDYLVWGLAAGPEYTSSAQGWQKWVCRHKRKKKKCFALFFPFAFLEEAHPPSNAIGFTTFSEKHCCLSSSPGGLTLVGNEALLSELCSAPGCPQESSPGPSSWLEESVACSQEPGQSGKSRLLPNRGSEANVRKTVSGLQTREDAPFSLEPLYPFCTWKMSPELPKPSSKSHFSSSLSRLSQSELVTRFPTTVTPPFSCTAYSCDFSSLNPKGKRSWPILLYVPQTWKHNSSDDNDES